MKRWPAAININLWPCAMRAARDTHNSLPMVGQEKSLMEVFSCAYVKPNIRHHHHFGCPVYVLDGDLQANKGSRKKWVDRARVGVNLGFSPQHSKSVALILSPKTGLVSPQFHCRYDDLFETVTGLNEKYQPAA